MKAIKMIRTTEETFEDGCEYYLMDCKQRNLREATINHYRQSYKQIYKSISKELPLSSFDVSVYNKYLQELSSMYDNDMTKFAYLRDLKTTLKFLMRQGKIPYFEMKNIKVSKPNVETYTDEELKLLLKKPNLKKCTFTEYKCWVMVNFLLSTGLRQRSLNNIKVKDLNLNNGTVTLVETKNRKPLIIPLNSDMLLIFKEYLKYRSHKSTDDYLFCNVYGQQLTKSTGYHMLYEYNKSRGVETTGIHRFRHTFAKQWIMNGGSSTSLSKLLGHSNLMITENYIHLIATDFADEVEQISILDKFKLPEKITMKK